MARGSQFLVRMETRDLSTVRLESENEIDNALDAVCDELRWRGRLMFEEQRRLHATHVLAAFLDLPAAERADVSLMAVA